MKIDRLDTTVLKRLEEFDGHEAVFSFTDEAVGLRGFIALHSTILGPATGGTRYWQYTSEEAALRDVLRLSKAMTYKCALAGVPFGGGKAVIMAKANVPKSQALFRSYARIINELQGQFSTGEDVGVDEKDVRTMAEESAHINGRPEISGDPSPWAALGVFYALQVALGAVFGDQKVVHRTVAVQGLGKVGLELSRLLSAQGGILSGADADLARVTLAYERFPSMKIVAPDLIYKQAVDVFCPCALGGVLNSDTIPQLQSKIVCGAANNQLASPFDAKALAARGIVYVPDYVANAGGLINVVDALEHGYYNRERVQRKLTTIQETTKVILDQAEKTGQSTSDITDQMVKQILVSKQQNSHVTRISRTI